MIPAEVTARNSGFTLTETLVVIALIGILFAAAAPQMRDLVTNSRIKQASAEMFSTMAYARSEAVSRDAQVTITAMGSWSNGWQVSAGNTVLKRSGPISNITITGPAASTITYNPNGRLSAVQPVTFVFSDPGNTRTVSRCVVSTLSGQPVFQADLNRDGNCTNG
jgi:type IV fimbrial biogenesis protein FimT